MLSRILTDAGATRDPLFRGCARHEAMTMSKSQRLRLRDLRWITRTVGECSELWADPNAWQDHLLRTAIALTRSSVGLFVLLDPLQPGRIPDTLTYHDYGWSSEADRRVVLEALSRGDLGQQPGLDALIRRARTKGFSAARRPDILPNHIYYNSTFYNEIRRRAGADDYIYSIRPLPHIPARGSLLNVNRPKDAPLYGSRERRLIRLLHAELNPFIGTRLATHYHHNLAGLTPRRRDVLERLLQGDSEKEAAHHLSISCDTLHEHVQALYAHFNVHSRGELLAHFIQRRPKAANPEAKLGPVPLSDRPHSVRV